MERPVIVPPSGTADCAAGYWDSLHGWWPDLAKPGRYGVRSSEIEALDFFDRAHGWVAAQEVWLPPILCDHAFGEDTRCWPDLDLLLPAGDLIPLLLSASVRPRTAGWPPAPRSGAAPTAATPGPSSALSLSQTGLDPGGECEPRLGPARRQPLAHHRRRRDLAAPHRGCPREGVFPDHARGMGHGRQQHLQDDRRRPDVASRLHPARSPGPRNGSGMR